MKDRHTGAERTRPGTRVLLLGGSLAHPSHTAALLRAVGAAPRAWPSSSGPSTCSWSGPRRCSRGLLAGVRGLHLDDARARRVAAPLRRAAGRGRPSSARSAGALKYRRPRRRKEIDVTDETPRTLGEPPGRLTRRDGPRPGTRRERGAPHAQISQTAPTVLQEKLLERARVLPGFYVGASLVSVPGAHALFLEASAAGGPPTAFQAGREFAHLHPPEYGSMHLCLPPVLAEKVTEKGWGEPYPGCRSWRGRSGCCCRLRLLLCYGVDGLLRVEVSCEAERAVATPRPAFAGRGRPDRAPTSSPTCRW